MGFHLDSQHVQMDPVQILCIVSHIFYIPALMMLWDRRYQYHIPFSFLVLMLLNSISFHFCQLTDGTLCMYPLETHRLFDHITAEYTIILIFILLMSIKNVMWLNLTVFLSFLLYALLKGIEDSLWFLAGFLVFFGILALWRMRGDRYNPLLFGAFIYLDAFSLVAYYLYQWYNITHPIWHVLSGLDLMVALALLFTSERNRVVAELQKVYPESHIAFEKLILSKESEIPFWEIKRETNTVLFYIISWPYSLYSLVTRCNIKEMKFHEEEKETSPPEPRKPPKRKEADNFVHLHLKTPEVVIVDQVVGPNGVILKSQLFSF